MNTAKAVASQLLAGRRLLLCLTFLGLLVVLPALSHSALSNGFFIRAWRSNLTDVQLDRQAQDVLADPVRRAWQLGVQALARGDGAEAIHALEDGLQDGSANPVLEGLLAQAYYQSGDYTTAIVYWERVGVSTPLYAMGHQAQQAERFWEAIQFLESSLKVKPNQPHAHYLLAYAYYRVGNPKCAVAQAQEAIRLDSGRNLGYRSTLAWIYAMTDDPRRAYEEYLAILSQSPDHPGVREGLARVERIMKEAKK